MQTRQLFALLACLILGLTSSAHAQTLAKRHQIGLSLGYWNQSAEVRSVVDTGGVSTSVQSSGGLGGIWYGHWVQENLAVTISVSGMVADAESVVGSGGVQSVTTVVAPILIGLKYYFPKSTLQGPSRPFVKASAGPYFGTQSSTNVGFSIAVEERTETAFGGQFGGGVDFILGRSVMLGFALGYNVMSDFSQHIGGSTNYSGPEFTIGISLLLGSGQQE